MSFFLVTPTASVTFTSTTMQTTPTPTHAGKHKQLDLSVNSVIVII